VSEKFTTIGIWGPNARETLKKVVADPAGLDIENFPFAAIKPIEIAGKTVSAFRLSYVGEQGWELHMKYEDGLAVWDALRRPASRRSVSRPMPIRAGWKRACACRTPIS
jgi:glycine cleavage system aminomethyltransferase T